MNLHRLVYTSSRQSNCTDDQIMEILSSCKKNNPKINVTGVLIYSSNRFLQYVEGDKGDISNLYEKIKKDDRHGGCNMRCFEPIEKRAFPSWEMAAKNLDQLEYISDVDSGNAQEIQGLIEGEIDFSDKGMKLLKLFFKI